MSAFGVRLIAQLMKTTMSRRALTNALLAIILLGWAVSLFAQTQVTAPAYAPAPSSASSAGSGGASTGAAATPPVQVTSHGDQLQVKVPDQAPLSKVMTSVCQQQKIKCTGVETLTSYRGPAMTVDGTLRQVIAKLVEGTDINYEFSRSTEGGGATAIAFLGHAPKGTAPVPSTPEPQAQTPGRPLHSRPFPVGKIPPEQGPPPEPQQ
jgi:hypothetical protein